MNTITIDFIYTKRDEFLEQNSNNILYKNGRFFGDITQTSSLLLEGGVNSFSHQKIKEDEEGFYLTSSQKVALYRLMKELAKKSDTMIINGSNENLVLYCNSIYRDSCG